MKPTLIFLFSIITAASFAQSAAKKMRETVDYPQILKDWNVKETKEFNNVKILRMAGENDVNHRTNLLYLSSFCEPDSLYGRLIIFTDRTTEKLADPSFLTVKVMDAGGDSVFVEYKLEGKPHSYKQDIWYNYIELNIPESVGKQFEVLISDAGLHQDFRFFVYGLPEFCYEK